MVAVVVAWWCFFLIFSGASELPTGISAQLPANGSPANRSAEEGHRLGEELQPGLGVLGARRRP